MKKVVATIIEGLLLVLLLLVLPWSLYLKSALDAMEAMPTVVHDRLNMTEEKEERGIALFQKDIHNISHAPFYIDGVFIMNSSSSAYLDLHVERQGLTNFEVILNGNVMGRVVSESGRVRLMLDKEYIKKGENELSITLNDKINFVVSYPSFDEYPLTVFNDSKIISDDITGVSFRTFTFSEKEEEIDCDLYDYNKDECLIAEAIQDKNLEICNSVSNRIACQIQVAKAINKPEICFQIESINTRTACYLELAISYRDNDYCKLAMRRDGCWEYRV